MRTSDKLLADLKKLHPRLIDLSLGRIERLLAKLGSPHKKLPPVIHVAGTNGKGSVTAYLAAMLESAGYRAHVYTSPHLVRFHERIALADPVTKRCSPIAEDGLVDVLTRVQAVNDGDDITQFEITTAAAFLAFAETPADALILEVGLGGRLDATNVIEKPLLSIITSISMDHADKLGDTIEKIAAEKAGIIKSGVSCVVSKQQDPAALDVISAKAEAVQSPLHIWGQDFEAFEQRGRLVFQSENRLLDLPMPALAGRHQVINAGTSIAAALNLPGFDLSEQAIATGLQTVRWPARLEHLSAGPLTDGLGSASELWLDGGHNQAAGEALAQSLADLEERQSRPLHLIVGMLALKDAKSFLRPFAGLCRHVTTVPIPGSHEAIHAPEILVECARQVGLEATPVASIECAISHVEKTFPGPKRIVICGSLYLAGHVLARQQGVEPQSN